MSTTETQSAVELLRQALAEYEAGHDDGGREFLAACTPGTIGALLAAWDELQALRPDARGNATDTARTT